MVPTEYNALEDNVCSVWSQLSTELLENCFCIVWSQVSIVLFDNQFCIVRMQLSSVHVPQCVQQGSRVHIA